jgi:hypothetical protein
MRTPLTHYSDKIRMLIDLWRWPALGSQFAVCIPVCEVCLPSMMLSSFHFLIQSGLSPNLVPLLGKTTVSSEWGNAPSQRFSCCTFKGGSLFTKDISIYCRQCMPNYYSVSSPHCNVQYPADKIRTLMFDVIFHFKFNNVQILNPNLDMLYTDLCI